MQVVIWIFSVLGVIGIGIGLGNLIYYLFWQRYAITREESVARSEFEKFKAALEAIEAKLQEEYITQSQFDRFREAIKEIM